MPLKIFVNKPSAKDGTIKTNIQKMYPTYIATRIRSGIDFSKAVCSLFGRWTNGILLYLFNHMTFHAHDD